MIEKLNKLIKMLEALIADTEWSDIVDLSPEDAKDILALLRKQKPQPVIFDRQCEVEPGRWERKGFCPKCHQEVLWMVNREYCGFCGQELKWND